MSEEKKGFFSRLVEGLTKTRNNIMSGFDAIFSGFSSIDEDFYEELEEVLVMAGLGIHTTENIIEELKKKVRDYVEKGETLAVLHANDQEKAGQAEERFLRAYRFSETQPPKRPMIFGEI